MVLRPHLGALLFLVACDGGEPADRAEDDGGADSATDSGGADTATDAETAEDTDTGDTNPLTDADGDGHDAPEHGGDDCDDANAGAYPGAEEWCDAVDQDCDGEALAPGVCGKVQEPWGGYGIPVATGMYVERALIVTDVTGDDVPDLYAAKEGDASSGTSGISAVYSGALVGGLPSAWPDGSAHALSEDSQADLTGRYLIDGGDFDGDGANDVVILDQMYGPASYGHLRWRLHLRPRPHRRRPPGPRVRPRGR